MKSRFDPESVVTFFLEFTFVNTFLVLVKILIDSIKVPL